MKKSQIEQNVFKYESVLENHFGHIISVCLHIVLFFMLLNWAVPKNESITKKVKIYLNPPEKIAPIQEQKTIPFIPAKQMTMPQPAEKIIEKKEEIKKVDSPVEKEFVIEKSVISELDAEKENLKKELSEISKTKELLKLNLMAEAKTVGEVNNYQYTADGAKDGVYRTLDMTGFSQEIIDSVMKQLDIKIENRYIKANQTGQSFLNSAKTSKQTYMNTEDGGGMYEVFLLSNKALAKMVNLEQEEIIKKGFKPNNTKINAVVFGIVQTEIGYDLGIKKFDAFQIIE